MTKKILELCKKKEEIEIKILKEYRKIIKDYGMECNCDNQEEETFVHCGCGIERFCINCGGYIWDRE